MEAPPEQPSESVPMVVESQPSESVLMVESQQPPKKSSLNKYALACALLASTSSVLLGYGALPFPFSFSKSQNFFM